MPKELNQYSPLETIRKRSRAMPTAVLINNLIAIEGNGRATTNSTIAVAMLAIKSPGRDLTNEEVSTASQMMFH